RGKCLLCSPAALLTEAGYGTPNRSAACGGVRGCNRLFGNCRAALFSHGGRYMYECERIGESCSLSPCDCDGRDGGWLRPGHASASVLPDSASRVSARSNRFRDNFGPLLFAPCGAEHK